MAASRPIVYLTAYYPPFGAGGAEFTTSIHARLLAEEGRRVIVVTPNYGAAERELRDGVEVVRFPFARLPEAGQQVLPAVFASRAHQHDMVKHTLGILRDERPLCLHAQNSSIAIVGSAVAKARGIPLVAHLRDTSMVCGVGAICLVNRTFERPPRACGVVRHARCYFGDTAAPGAAPIGVASRVKRTVAHGGPYRDFLRRKAAYHAADRLAFACRALSEMHAEIDGFEDTRRHRVVYASLVEEPEGGRAPLPEPVARVKAAGAPIILYVGKLSRGKGVDVLFAAHRELLRAFPEARLVVAGNIHRNDWGFDESRTIALGFVNREVLRALYDACDLVVVPSTWPEPLGWGTLEAGRHGKPLVATRVGGIPEAVEHGVSGLLVDKGDVAGMARAMAAMLKDPDMAARLGRTSYTLVRERFGPKAVRRQLSDLYEGFDA